jgi:peptidoglycan/LPS O-acetylase OafA/YrhL
MLPPSLSLDPKKNSIGLLRLVLAMLVIVSHAYELGGFGYDPLFYWSRNGFSLGAIAVDGFFVLSGLLITASYFRAGSVGRYLWQRIVRIFPGYWACIVITGVALPLIFGRSPELRYIVVNALSPALSAVQSAIGLLVPIGIGWSPNLENVGNKLVLFQGQSFLTGLFTNNPYTSDVNGSLWTLAQEFRLYIMVALLGVVGLLRRRVIIALLLVCWLAYCVSYWKTHQLADVSPFRTSAHFWMGALMYFGQFPLRRSLVLLSMIVGLGALFLDIYPVVSPLTTTYLMFWLAMVLPFQGFARKTDYSYGLYIYSFPLQQTLTALGMARFGFPVFMGLSFLSSFAMAVFSWHVVERNALKLKSLFQRRPSDPEVVAEKVLVPLQK